MMRALHPVSLMTLTIACGRNTEDPDQDPIPLDLCESVKGLVGTTYLVREQASNCLETVAAEDCGDEACCSDADSWESAEARLAFYVLNPSTGLYVEGLVGRDEDRRAALLETGEPLPGWPFVFDAQVSEIATEGEMVRIYATDSPSGSFIEPPLDEEDEKCASTFEVLLDECASAHLTEQPYLRGCF